MRAVFAIVLFVALATAAERRIIKAPKGVTPRLPNLALQQGLFPGNETWEAGYIDFPAADTTFHFFYWKFASRSDPVNDPTVFWFTGGPGCASDLALFAENGPYHFHNPADPSTIYVNEFSWNNNANLVFIDQPVGTGFSYADADVFERDEDEVAADVYKFTQGFYQKYPELHQNPLFITGESYGGHYVPAISNLIVTNNGISTNKKIPFAGCAIGNGLVNPALQYPQYAPFVYSYGFISKFDVEKYAIEIKPCQAALKIGAYGTAFEECNIVMQGILSASGVKNVYNVHAGCPAPPLCYNFEAATTLLNNATIQAALGVANGIQWESCNFQVNGEFHSDWMHSMADRLQNVLAANYTVLIYSGKLDYICNYFGGRAWTAALEWAGQSGFNAAATNPWEITLVNGTKYHAGDLKVYQNFAWLEVNNAGHMVPMDQPQAAIQMLNRYISQGFRG